MPDHAHLQSFASRVATQACLADYRVKVEVTDSKRYTITGGGGRCRRSLAPASFGGVSGKTVTFLASEQVPLAEDGVVASLAHEAAHAYRAIHGLRHRDHNLEECLTDITEFYLGFGVFSVNEAYSTLEEGSDRLSPWGRSYLLAAQIVARRMSCWQAFRLLRHVHTMARRDVKRAMALLRPSDELWKKLNPEIPEFDISTSDR